MTINLRNTYAADEWNNFKPRPVALRKGREIVAAPGLIGRLWNLIWN